MDGYLDLQSVRINYFKQNQLELKKQFQLFNNQGFYEGEKFLKYLYGKYYYSENHLNGSVYLMDMGCAIRAILIITGNQKGKIWIDDRANGNGIFPVLNSKGLGIGLFDYLCELTDNLFN